MKKKIKMANSCKSLRESIVFVISIFVQLRIKLNIKLYNLIILYYKLKNKMENELTAL